MAHRKPKGLISKLMADLNSGKLTELEVNNTLTRLNALGIVPKHDVKYNLYHL